MNLSIFVLPSFCTPKETKSVALNLVVTSSVKKLVGIWGTHLIVVSVLTADQKLVFQTTLCSFYYNAKNSFQKRESRWNPFKNISRKLGYLAGVFKL